MPADREVVYLGRDNSIDVILKADGTAQPLSSVTHMELVVSGVTFSSVTPDYFDWSGSTTGFVSITLGQSSVLTPGSYDSELIVYDTSNTSGIYWGEIPIRIKG